MTLKNTLFISLFLLVTYVFSQVDKEHRSFIEKEKNIAFLKMKNNSAAITDNYDLVFNRLELEPNMNHDHIDGIVTAYYKPTSDINHIQFDLVDQLQVNSVTQRGNSLTFTHSGNVLDIQFPTTANTGVLDSLTINYNGTPPNSGFDSYVTATHGSGVPIVWTLSEPFGARDWWPCKQDLVDKIDSLEVILKYPAQISGQSLKGVSNGLLISETVSNGTRTSVWKTNYPITAYLVAFAITNYQKYTLNVGITQSFPIDNFFYPESASQEQTDSQAVIPVMNYYENTFGLYPFRNEKYGQAQFGWGGGMEHQTITFLINYNRGLMAHELAHQWFGDAITCSSWNDIWLNEGFATYCEGLIKENLVGEEEFIAWKADNIEFIAIEPGGSVYIPVANDVDRIFDGRLTYTKGGMVLNMLRLKMGDISFFQGLRNYVNQKSFNYASTQEFKDIMSNTSITELNLDEFFNDWIYGEGYPTYNINVVRSGIHRYRITVNQTTSDSSVDFFEMPLPFKFIDNSGHVFEVKLDNTQNGQIFEVNIGFDATKVLFDPKFDIVKGETNLNANLSVADYTKSLFNIYPNPAYDFITIDNKNNINITNISVYDIIGRKISVYRGNTNKISVKNLPEGTYFINISDKQKTYIYKTIVKH